MERSRRSMDGSPFWYVVAAVAIGFILVLLLIPGGFGCLSRGAATQTVNNARQIHIATMRMVLDYELEPDPKVGWPGDLPDVKSLSDFVERLVEYQYIDRGDIKALFYAPGVTPYPGTGPFSSENSAFRIYKVTKADRPEVIFMATKNFTFGKPLNPKAVPYGNKGAVIIRKSGEGLIINDQQAAKSDSGELGLMPGAATKGAPGTERDVLK